MIYCIVTYLFCTHLTFDLILRLWSISRLGIHPYGCWHSSRNTISMDTKFYSILPSKVKISLFYLNGLPTNKRRRTKLWLIKKWSYFSVKLIKQHIFKSKCSCRRKSPWWFSGANWKFRHSGNCSASFGKPRDAEQLPSWRNFQSAPHNH